MKIKALIIFLFASFVMHAQKFSGKAIYKSHQKSNIKLDSTMIAKNPGIQKIMEEKMKKFYQQTYILNFNQSESTYKRKPKLNQPNPKAGASGVIVKTVFIGGGDGSNDVLYKNIKEKRYANKTDLMGKTFLVKDELNAYDWEMTGNTKNIGNYTVYEAKWTREEEDISMTMVNGDAKETKKKEMRTTTVWYTPQIPISNGPNRLWGLPGLILEVNDGRRTIVCTEIILNPKEKISIAEPKKGKVVDGEKFEKISRQKSREMMERFKSRNGVNIGGGINIKAKG